MQVKTSTARVRRERCASGVIVAAFAIISRLVDPSCTAAQDSPSPAPGDGRIWYEKYCTPCHGVSGAPGEAVFVTSEQPVDLRTYVQRHGGKFPAGEWLMVVVAEPLHNPHTKVWERIRHDERSGMSSETSARARVKSIADYVLSIQAK